MKKIKSTTYLHLGKEGRQKESKLRRLLLHRVNEMGTSHLLWGKIGKKRFDGKKCKLGPPEPKRENTK